jgi:hypothetical protein
MWFGGVVIGWNIDELQNKWSSSDNSAATGQEISADDVFEDGGFARGLGTDNDLEEISTTELRHWWLNLRSEVDPSYHSR